MKRLIVVALALATPLVAFFALSGSPAEAIGISGTFLDDDGSFHEPDINAIAAAGITAGCGPSVYCPNAAVTRAEMATFLTRALELTPQASGPFTDIGGNLHAPNINAIAAANITRGCSATAFCPGQSVTREEMASFLARGLHLPPGSGSPFTDVTGGVHAADIAAIAEAGITTGCAPARYCPFNPVTRAQMASFLARAFELPRIYPQIPMVEGVSLFCSKDGLACQGSISVPYRGTYEFREGFYDSSATGGLASGNTRVEFTINGNPTALTALPIVSGAATSSRLYQANFSLAPGTHTLVARWYWNGFLEQTTTLFVTVFT